MIHTNTKSDLSFVYVLRGNENNNIMAVFDSLKAAERFRNSEGYRDKLTRITTYSVKGEPTEFRTK